MKLSKWECGKGRVGNENEKWELQMEMEMREQKCENGIGNQNVRTGLNMAMGDFPKSIFFGI